MKCATGNCNQTVSDRYPDAVHCDDCYEYIYLRLPDKPPIFERFKAWFQGRTALEREAMWTGTVSKPDPIDVAHMTEAEVNELARKILEDDRKKRNYP